MEELTSLSKQGITQQYFVCLPLTTAMLTSGFNFLPACCFLLVFCSNHSHKMHFQWAGGMCQMDRLQHCLMFPVIGEGLISTDILWCMVLLHMDIS